MKLKKYFPTKKKIKKYFLKARICFNIMFDGKHERVIQYLYNRLYDYEGEHFYIEDEALLNKIKYFKKIKD